MAGQPGQPKAALAGLGPLGSLTPDDDVKHNVFLSQMPRRVVLITNYTTKRLFCVVSNDL